MNRHRWLLHSAFAVVAVLVFTVGASAQVTYTVFGFDQSVPEATQPAAGVIKGSDGAFYGTTQNGNFCGAVYRLAPDGTRTILHIFKGSFAAPPDGPDGCEPVGELVEGPGPDHLLYGVTRRGGPHVDPIIVSETGTGTIFRISPQGDGVLYEILYAFAGTVGNGVFPEGILPEGGLTKGFDNNLYGTTSYGGTGGPDGNGSGCTAGAGTAGTFFRFDPPFTPSDFHVLHSFDPATEGCGPSGNLTRTADGSFVGVTVFGGYTQTVAYAGTVFKVTPTGTLSPLFMFPGNPTDGYLYGAGPTSAPIEAADGSLFGTTPNGGPRMNGNEAGTVYKLTPVGLTWEPTLLHAFTGPDGAFPVAGLTFGADGDLYGVTTGGGPISNGTLFSITPNATPDDPPMRLHTFGCLDIECTVTDPNDGFGPEGRLLEALPGTFIGTTRGGNGSSLGGSVFSLDIGLSGATSTALATSTTAAVFGESVTFTATVSSGSGTPTGEVEFFDGSTSLGTATLSGGQAVLVTSALAVGTHTISAEYQGDGTFFVSTSGTVDLTVSRAATTLSLDSLPNPSARKQVVTVTATVVAVAPGGGTATGQVQLMDGKKKLGTAILENGVATFQVAFNNMGSHVLTATYLGDGNFLGSTSASLTQTVTR